MFDKDYVNMTCGLLGTPQINSNIKNYIMQIISNTNIIKENGNKSNDY